MNETDVTFYATVAQIVPVLLLALLFEGGLLRMARDMPRLLGVASVGGSTLAMVGAEIMCLAVLGGEAPGQHTKGILQLLLVIPTTQLVFMLLARVWDRDHPSFR